MGGWGQAVPRAVAAAREPLAAAVASETYLGMVACERCAGTRVELALYRAGDAPGHGPPAAYHMRETFYGTPDGDQVRDTNGVWSEIPDPGPEGHGWVVELANGRSQGLQYFERVEKNDGELVLLDAQLHELPGDLPHKLGRVTGDHQLRMVLLTEGDDGRTVEMRPGEVFAVRLETKRPAGYTWTSDRPAAMALLETGAEPAAGAGAAAVSGGAGSSAATAGEGAASLGQGSAGSGQGPARARAVRASRGTTSSAAQRPAEPEYQVWQLIAPPPGVLALRFECRLVSDMAAPPVRFFTLTVVTR